jgi:hypothetical protein
VSVQSTFSVKKKRTGLKTVFISLVSPTRVQLSGNRGIHNHGIKAFDFVARRNGPSKKENMVLCCSANSCKYIYIYFLANHESNVCFSGSTGADPKSLAKLVSAGCCGFQPSQELNMWRKPGLPCVLTRIANRVAS